MALVSCSECGHSVSDKANACPHCGAPSPLQGSGALPDQLPQRGASFPEAGGRACPFSGHPIPAEATVCVCGAYYGYKGGVLTDQKFGLLLKLLGVCVALVLLGYMIEWDLGLLIGSAGTLIFGIVFVVFVLPIKLQGQKWWREM
jgi:hypothetical protein